MLDAQKEGLQHIIVCYDPLWLQGRFAQHDVVLSHCRFVCEPPRGRRSFVRWIQMRGYRQMHYIDTIIIGGGEIMTEESGSGYIYWLRILQRWRRWRWRKPEVILMGGVQPPKKRLYRMVWRRWRAHVMHIYARSYQGVADLHADSWQNVSYCMDTSRWALQRDDYGVRTKSAQDKDIVILNINPLAQKHWSQRCAAIRSLAPCSTLFFLPMTGGVHDADIAIYKDVKAFCQTLGRDVRLLDWTADFAGAMYILGHADHVLCSRLHCYLLSMYLGRRTVVFEYQYKIQKMRADIESFFVDTVHT